MIVVRSASTTSSALLDPMLRAVARLPRVRIGRDGSGIGLIIQRPARTAVWCPDRTEVVVWIGGVEQARQKLVMGYFALAVALTVSMPVWTRPATAQQATLPNGLSVSADGCAL
jgi:hypothetical protein